VDDVGEKNNFGEIGLFDVNQWKQSRMRSPEIGQLRLSG
jgi:hypothetical protein